MVHLEERERLGGHILGDGAVAAHLGPIAHALQQAVGQTRSAPGTAGNLKRTLLVDGNVQNGSRAAHDERELLGRVVLQAEGHAEAVAQRTGEQARARRGADEREARQIQAEWSGPPGPFLTTISSTKSSSAGYSTSSTMRFRR